ncbi:Non-specific lipid transfer protein GPI-anchored 1 [Vitis vinifera]|uniref:Non-specific lipid transfer protein GPI-anchored 1 n=1 Tax=Vitis vinifera TaxID=29760 RepID=A0A438DX12_VITVI|nr:Non-specific lipid transfer protein GPI-anchored 1 [Vitis vinifera]
MRQRAHQGVGVPGVRDGKAATPTKDCCSAVSEIRESKPVCLCYFIQQAHNGSAEAKSLGIQEAKLLQLPSACKMANASLSDCPSVSSLKSTFKQALIYGEPGSKSTFKAVTASHGELLNISASSPDYSIFTSNSTSTAPASTSTGTSSGAKDDESNADMYAPSLAGTMAIAVAIFFSMLSQQGLPPQAGEGFFFG